MHAGIVDGCNIYMHSDWQKFCTRLSHGTRVGQPRLSQRLFGERNTLHRGRYVCTKHVIKCMKLSGIKAGKIPYTVPFVGGRYILSRTTKNIEERTVPLGADFR